MKRKNLFTSAVIIATLSFSIGLSGCGKQGVEPVMAATIETLTSEVTTEEESVVATEGETESVEESVDENEYATATAEEAKEEYTITEMNLEMQATQNAMTYEKPDGNTEVSGVRKDEIIEVTGIVDGSDWYQINQEGFKSFINSKYLKEIDPPQQQEQAQNDNNNNNNANNNNQQQQPKAETPKENPQPPVVNPPAPSGDGGVQVLPDGGLKFDDGTELHPGDVSADGSTTYMGNGDYMFDEPGW